MAGKLTQVFSLWPGRDGYIDHSADFLAAKPITLFALDQLVTAPHHLYLSHSTLLALAGNVNLGVEFELARAPPPIRCTSPGSIGTARCGAGSSPPLPVVSIDDPPAR